MASREQSVDPRSAWQVALVGALVVGFAYGMGRYAYGLTLPSVRDDLGLSGWLAGSIAGATFAGFLVALLALGPLTARRGPRAPVLVGAVLGTAGALLVAVSSSPAPHAVGAVATGASAGLVWAPFSDLLQRLAPAALGSTLLSVVTTGTSGGLVALGAASVVVGAPGWRVVWALTAALGALSTVLVWLVVPRTPAVESPRPGDRESWRSDAALARGPLLYAVPYLAGVVVWFTFATDAVREQGLPARLGAALFVLVAITGLAGLLTGRLVGRWGPARVGGAALGGVAVALALLGLPTGSATVLVVSAVVLGPGYMIGSALLAVWTARVVPRRAGRTFVMTLVSGSVASAAAPPVVSLLASAVGLGAVLTGAAALLAVVAGAMVLRG